MICASAMLAVFLCWPFLFGGADNTAAAAQPTRRGSGAVTMIVPPAAAAPTVQARATQAPATQANTTAAIAKPDAAQPETPAPLPRTATPAPPHGPAGETCTQHYARIVPACTNEGCRTRAADALDICQGTGFWPE
jgi:hypothetical protein